MSINLKRVVVTGIGAVTPLGCGIEHVWQRILAGESGISKLPEFLNLSKEGVHVAGQVPQGEAEDPYSYNLKQVFGRNIGNEMSKITQYGVYASDLALKHAGNPLQGMTDEQLTKVGVVLATGGVGSISDIVSSGEIIAKNGSARKLSPYFIPKVLTNMAAGHISLRHNLRGPLLSPSTACAASSHAIGDAYNLIRMGYADIILAGGSESCIDSLSISGFNRMRALTSEKDPTRASRPFDNDRNGFVIAEGSCILVLEDRDSAVARNAPIIAELCGYGLSSDAHHITAPSPTGEGVIRCMQMAIKDAGVAIHDIDYINAHATSTPQGDAIEAGAISRLFNSDGDCGTSVCYISSTKGATGHLLGAAGALESAFAALAVRDNIVPPTLNLNNLSSGLELHNNVKFVANQSMKTKTPLNYSLKNSLGFSGTNASLVFGKISDGSK